jgi:hypothetical protein
MKAHWRSMFTLTDYFLMACSLSLPFHSLQIAGPSQGLRVQVDKPHPASVASTQPVVAGCALQVVRHCSNDSFEAAGLDSLCPIVHHAHLCYAQLVLLYIGQPKFGAHCTGDRFSICAGRLSQHWQFYKPLQACDTPLGSENNNFFKWLFTKTAISVIGGWKSGLDLSPSLLLISFTDAW